MIYKYLCKTLVVGLLAGAAVANAADSKVSVFLKSGNADEVKISETGFIYFENNIMNILTDGSNESLVAYPLANIQKLCFSEHAAAPRVLAEGEVVLYPTVANSQVFLANASAKEIQIVDMAGKVVLSSAYQAGQAIEVGSLAAGMYILKADGLTFKFQKK